MVGETTREHTRCAPQQAKRKHSFGFLLRCLLLCRLASLAAAARLVVVVVLLAARGAARLVVVVVVEAHPRLSLVFVFGSVGVGRRC